MTLLSSRITLALLAGIAALSVSGCKTSDKAVATPSTSAVPPAEAWAGRQEVKDALALLNAGDSVKARKLLMKALKKEPGNFVARRLIDQIDKDPKQLLGAASFPYLMQQGDSFSQLAQKHLGDPMLFYALARYNNVAVPSSPPVGTMIQIPGKAPVVTKPAVKPAPAARKPAPVAKAPPRKAPPAVAAKKPAPPAADPARAGKLRAAGLAAMSKGDINRAVAFLRQAQSADPNSAVIKADLNKALRIQGTVGRK